MKKLMLPTTKREKKCENFVEHEMSTQSGLIPEDQTSPSSEGTTIASDIDHNSDGTIGQQSIEAVEIVAGVGGVGGVGGQPTLMKKPRRRRHLWIKGEDPAVNLRRLAKKLNKSCDRLFRNSERGPGLIHKLPDGTSVLISTGKQLASIVIDHLRVTIEDETGKRAGDVIPNSILDLGLISKCFLEEFPPLDRVVTRPFYCADFTLSSPGYHQDTRIFYHGGLPEFRSKLELTCRFLDQVDFLNEADRTNCLAAAILCLLHEFWPGCKPMIRIVANKSHAGKGTIVTFIVGDAAVATLSIGEADWALETKLQSQLEKNPAIGIISVDNARTDSVGSRGQKFSSAFYEYFITSETIRLATPKGRTPFIAPNRFVMLFNSNDGLFSTDFLNRSLTIRLDTKGDIQTRQSPLGNLKYDFLPTSLPAITAELRGGIERWRLAGCPIDESIRHPMGPCMKVLGGIVKFLGFNGFNGNYSEAKTSDDPIRAAIALLACDNIGTAKTPREWAKCAVRLGVDQELLPREALSNIIAMEREMGRLMKAHIEETFHCGSEKEKLRVRLTGGQRRWENGKNSNRYVFEPIEETGHKIVIPTVHEKVNNDEDRFDNASHIPLPVFRRS